MPSGVYTLETEARGDINQALAILQKPGAEDQSDAVDILGNTRSMVQEMMDMGDMSLLSDIKTDLGHAGSLVIGCDPDIRSCGDRAAAAQAIQAAMSKVRQIG